ncbi:MAG: TIGR02206 family membrane protein [Gelidibacter sp.]|nr:TIGR02206 family membrane protein [Gelidibacter sp.]
MILKTNLYFQAIERVSIGSVQHIAPVFGALIFAIVFIWYSKKKLSNHHQKKAIHYVAIIVSLTVASFHIYKITLGNYQVKSDLPLYLCSLIALLVPLFTYKKAYWMYEILVFWIIAGTLQGVITPDIAEGFPSFDYFRYWVVHLGLLLIIFYATVVFKMRPRFKSVFKSILALQVYVAMMVATNIILDANYFYLNEKPQSASLLDYFGEWPYYILVTQLILIPYFLIIYLPFYLVNKKSST